MSKISQVLVTWSYAERDLTYGEEREWLVNGMGRDIESLIEEWGVYHKGMSVMSKEKLVAEKTIDDILAEARRKAGRSGVKTAYGKKAYVTVVLTPEDRPAIVELAKDAYGVLSALHEMSFAGYAVRIAYSEKEKSVKVFVDGDATKANRGKILETGASDLRLALASACYKVAVKCDFGSWDTSVDGDEWFS